MTPVSLVNYNRFRKIRVDVFLMILADFLGKGLEKVGFAMRL